MARKKLGATFAHTPSVFLLLRSFYEACVEVLNLDTFSFPALALVLHRYILASPLQNHEHERPLLIDSVALFDKQGGRAEVGGHDVFSAFWFLVSLDPMNLLCGIFSFSSRALFSTRLFFVFRSLDLR